VLVPGCTLEKPSPFFSLLSLINLSTGFFLVSVPLSQQLEFVVSGPPFSPNRQPLISSFLRCRSQGRYFCSLPSTLMIAPCLGGKDACSAFLILFFSFFLLPALTQSGFLRCLKDAYCVFRSPPFPFSLIHSSPSPFPFLSLHLPFCIIDGNRSLEGQKPTPLTKSLRCFLLFLKVKCRHP